MPRGRCAGCGTTDTSRKVIIRHVVVCPDYIALYKTDPSKALDPIAEQERWEREENDPDTRAAEKDLKLQRKFAELDTHREAHSRRWETPKDILDD